MRKSALILISLIIHIAATAQVSDYATWMSGLDDRAFVCQLSIPGAHDACSSSFSGILSFIYKSSAQTQSKSVEAMLPLGVRLFDLRPCVSGSKLHINHGVATTSYDFDPVMAQLCSYLDAHPTEFCIVVIRHESEGDSNNANFGSMLQASLAKIKDHLVDFRPNLTVGEARGKILFLSRDEYDAPIYGGRIVDLKDNRSDISEMLGGHCYGSSTNRCAWWMQDHYEFSSDAVKQQAIRDMLARSTTLAGGYTYTWVVNQTSGYKGTSSSASAYQNNAKTSNKYMQELLESGAYDGPAGLVFMDYAADGDNAGYYGLSLTQALVNHNFRYDMSHQGDDIYQGKNLFVASKGRDMMWEAKCLRKEGPSQPAYEDASAASQLDAVAAPTGWFTADFDDSDWETRRFPTASDGTDAPYYSRWDGTYNVLYIRREFTIDHDPTIDTYRFYVFHDDDYKVYLNGVQLDAKDDYSTNFNSYRVVNIASSRLKTGRNVLAIQVQQNWGGAYFDCGVLRTEGTRATLKLTSDKWHTFIAPGHNVDFSSTDVKAYKIVEIAEGRIPYAKAEEVSIVPAGEAVVVRSDKGAGTYYIPVTPSAAGLHDNLLMVTPGLPDVAEENTIYCIAEQNGKSGFYAQKAGTAVPQGTVCLDLSGRKTETGILFIDCDDEETGMPVPTATDNGSKQIYNMSGQHITGIKWQNGKWPRGIYITGGKKVLH